MSGRGRYFTSSKPDKSYKLCDQHEFTLRPLGKANTLFFQDKVSVNYCLNHDSTTCPHIPNNISYLKQFSTMPFMPTFGNSHQIQYYKKHTNQYKKQYDQQIQRAERIIKIEQQKLAKQKQIRKIIPPQTEGSPRLRIKQQEIFEPIPNKSYCQVCRIQFDDYMGHIQTKLHKDEVKNSVGKELIQQELYRMKLQNDSIEQTTDYKQILKSWKISKNFKKLRKAFLFKLVQ